MSEICLCKSCGQPLPPKQREGVWLPAKKAAIFDFINQHPGIWTEGLAAQFNISLAAVRVHINQINAMLAATDIRISGDSAGPWVRGEYRIIRDIRTL